MRVTGGAFAAGRLPENYYGQFIKAAQQGGMAAVCATEQYQERIAANPATSGRLMSDGPEALHRGDVELAGAVQAGAKLAVLGMTEAELRSIAVPSVVIPGNDQTHDSESGRTAQRLIPGSVLHQLPIEDQNVPLIPFPGMGPVRRRNRARVHGPDEARQTQRVPDRPGRRLLTGRGGCQPAVRAAGG